jgi:hypothetical protein
MKTKLTIKISSTLLLDAIAVLFIIFIGDISKFIGYPVYILDPMRMMLILAFAFTPRWNGWILALLLPFVSYFLGAHPSITKTTLMAAELLLNVWLFWFLIDKIKMALLSILISIVFSKVVYYLLKFICIQIGWLSGELISTPLDIQVITTLSFSAFIFIVFLFNGKPKRR